MKTVVVYESLWGNTAAIARAIAEGIGQGALALSTAEARAQPLAALTCSSPEPRCWGSGFRTRRCAKISN